MASILRPTGSFSLPAHILHKRYVSKVSRPRVLLRHLCAASTQIDEVPQHWD